MKQLLVSNDRHIWKTKRQKQVQEALDVMPVLPMKYNKLDFSQLLQKCYEMAQTTANSRYLWDDKSILILWFKKRRMFTNLGWPMCDVWCSWVRFSSRRNWAACESEVTWESLVRRLVTNSYRHSSSRCSRIDADHCHWLSSSKSSEKHQSEKKSKDLKTLYEIN